MKTSSKPLGGRQKAVESGQSLEIKNLLLKEIEKSYAVNHAKTHKIAELWEVTENNKIIGYYGTKKFYEFIKLTFEPHFGNEYMKKVIYKTQPDGYLFIVKTMKLVIFEFKNQNAPGSVDEKLQSAHYKLHLYEMLLKPANLNLSFEYVLNNFFNGKKYQQLNDYYQLPRFNDLEVKFHILNAEDEFNKSFDIKSYFA